MKYTIERKCSTDDCGHIFASVPILYGTSALGKCPKCGVFCELKLEQANNERAK